MIDMWTRSDVVACVWPSSQALYAELAREDNKVSYIQSKRMDSSQYWVCPRNYAAGTPAPFPEFGYDIVHSHNKSMIQGLCSSCPEKLVTLSLILVGVEPV